MSFDLTLAIFPSLPGGAEWIVIAILGLLIFGKRLPEVGKSLGRSIVEFKKGLKGVEQEIDDAVDSSDQADMLPPPESKSGEQAGSTSTESSESKAKETV
jgi:sec-independent protein translocase protein TatA